MALSPMMYSIMCYLEPLAIAANIVQSAFCCLDQVLLIFGYLVMQYKQPEMAKDPVGCDAIINSIEMRWRKSDQELFIAAVLVNPFYHNKPFVKLPFLTNAEIWVLFCHLWQQLFKTTVPDNFEDLLHHFFASTGSFAGLESQCDYAVRTAHSKVNRIY